MGAEEAHECVRVVLETGGAAKAVAREQLLAAASDDTPESRSIGYVQVPRWPGRSFY